MIRLDKYLANVWLVSRRQIDSAIKAWLIFVNGEEIKKSDYKLSFGDTISFDNQEIQVREHTYALLYKPAGYISSDEDEWGYKSYRHLLQDCPYVHTLHVAGRLDQDTEWVLLLSSDGKFIHQVISPKREKEKEYEAYLERDISEEECEQLTVGVTLDDGYHTMPAKVQKLSSKKILLTITEWKYHQIKRMLEAIGNKVVYLKRLRVGEWTLNGLKKGEWKYID